VNWDGSILGTSLQSRAVVVPSPRPFLAIIWLLLLCGGRETRHPKPQTRNPEPGNVSSLPSLLLCDGRVWRTCPPGRLRFSGTVRDSFDNSTKKLCDCQVNAHPPHQKHDIGHTRQPCNQPAKFDEPTNTRAHRHTIHQFTNTHTHKHTHTRNHAHTHANKQTLKIYTHKQTNTHKQKSTHTSKPTHTHINTHKQTST